MSKGGRHQRRLRNYLLDPQFQLKYTGYLVAIALVLSAALGFLLWRTSQTMLAQSRQTVTQGEQVVKRGREVVTESKKVSEVVKMNIVKDPDYQDNPALLSAFKEGAKKQDERLASQQKALEEQSAALKQQSQRLEEQSTTIAWVLSVVLALLVIFIGIAGIIVTHRVAGPIFKMKRHINDVTAGNLSVPSALRKGDELVHFFEAFSDMVKQLRSRQEAEIALLDDAIEKLEAKAEESDLAPLRALRAEMADALEPPKKSA